MTPRNVLAVCLAALVYTAYVNAIALLAVSLLSTAVAIPVGVLVASAPGVTVALVAYAKSKP